MTVTKQHRRGTLYIFTVVLYKTLKFAVLLCKIIHFASRETKTK